MVRIFKLCHWHLNKVYFFPNQTVKLNVKLQGPVVDDYISEGVVQVEHEGKWGYICPSSWTFLNSYVLCGQLGFPNATKLESYSETVQEVKPDYWLSQVTCKGLESSILSCDHAGLGRHECENSEVVKVKCFRRNITKVTYCSLSRSRFWRFVRGYFP